MDLALPLGMAVAASPTLVVGRMASALALPPAGYASPYGSILACTSEYSLLSVTWGPL